MNQERVLYGAIPDHLKNGSGDGDGSGYGYGSGYGSGDGSGYGYGSGYGSGDGSGYGYGYGDGSGYGDGDGSGSGYGYGSGYGSGDGSGYGYGSGSGDGSGYGYGYGDGSGYGYGYGYGYGHGSGYGYGYGDGSGYGSGDGYGYGHGSGSKEYWVSTISHFAAKWSVSQQKRLAELKIEGCQIAFWRSNKNGEACNGGNNNPVKVGTIEEIPGPLKICTRKGLHATMIPPKWEGERLWLVALKGEVQWQDDKCAALVREVIGECL